MSFFDPGRLTVINEENLDAKRVDGREEEIGPIGVISPILFPHEDALKGWTTSEETQPPVRGGRGLFLASVGVTSRIPPFALAFCISAWRSAIRWTKDFLSLVVRALSSGSGTLLMSQV